jgi:hypothetical protein
MFASRPMEADLHPLQSVNRRRARRRFSAFPSPFRWQRSKIEIDDEDEDGDEHSANTTTRTSGRARIGKSKDLWSKSLKISAKT